MKVSVIIPAFNEDGSLPLVLSDLPPVHEVIVVDNNSSDATAHVARENGAKVVQEKRQGYGSACLKGIEAVDDPDIIVFLDADFSDYPEEMTHLVGPIITGESDFVIGSRMIFPESRQALLPQARYGNRLAVWLMHHFFGGFRFTDLGPFRALRYQSLKTIGMQDKDFGWTVEMQIKAIQHKLRIQEIPVRYRKRVGISKITGTVSGTFRAGVKIIYTIFKYLLTKQGK